MDVVPVMEIKEGRLIKAVEGRYDECEEFKSKVIDSHNPLELALKYEELGFSEIYVADLDGIVEDKPNYDLLKDVSEKTGLKVMADIGTWSIEDMLNLSRVKPVIATETFESLNMLNIPRDFVISLDTKEGVLLSPMNISLENFVEMIKDCVRIKEVLVMDLSRYWLPRGPNVWLCRYILEKFPEKTVIYGGGVRNLDDVIVLASIGVSKILAGYALHTGNLLDELNAAGLLRKQ